MKKKYIYIFKRYIQWKKNERGRMQIVLPLDIWEGRGRELQKFGQSFSR